jgi:hypothetical protein
LLSRNPYERSLFETERSMERGMLMKNYTRFAMYGLCLVLDLCPFKQSEEIICSCMSFYVYSEAMPCSIGIYPFHTVQ